MRRALCLVGLVVLISCSDRKDGGDNTETDPDGPDPITREDAGDDDTDMGDEDAPEDAGATEGDVRAEPAVSDAGAKPNDAGTVGPDADAGQTLERDAAMVDATAELDAAMVDASEGADAASVDAAVDASQSDAGQDAGSSGDAAASEVACIDQQIAQLILFDAPATGAITEEGGEPGAFSTLIDATAGGLTTSQSFVYARFTENGLEKVSVGDEAAFASSSWHIAARRYVLRVNSGVSGPGSVRAARTAPGTTFADLQAVPDGLAYRTEQYYTESCEFVPDTSGIGAPATALSSFWSYAGCVKMTNNVFVLELPDQHHVKLQVFGYYPLENQQRCDTTDMINLPSGAGNLRIRWAFLD